MASILIVEDERLLGKTLQASLKDDGHDVHWVVSAEEALARLEKHQADLALVDVGLPGIDGLELLRSLNKSHPDTAVLMMTAHGDVATAVAAMKLGAADFLLKPVDLEAVSLIANRNLREGRRAQSWRHEQKRRAQEFGLHNIIGEAPGVERAREMVRRLARIEPRGSAMPPHVLITGETGTGKDLLAKALHYEGARQEGPFVHINCAALPAALVESELFGHAKGAFTQAHASKRGLFEVAHQGTLFLDEINSLDLALQAKILVAIEAGRIRPVGSVDERTVNVQLVAAMNEDPERLVEQNRLREDLYHRLRVVHLHLPPLRERGADLLTLAEHFVGAHCRRFGLKPRSLSVEAKKAVRRYHWPGNVRELCHRLESAVLLSEEIIEAEMIPAPRAADPLAGGTNGDVIHINFASGPMPLEQVEKVLISRALSTAEFNITRAAELLDLSRDALRYRAEKFDLLPRKTEGART